MNSFTFSRKKGVWLQILLIIAACLSLLFLALELYRQTVNPLSGDAAIFLAVSRGIVNGLTPYINLFETKPPGIFLLGALSLALFDNFLICRASVILVLTAIPLLFWTSVKNVTGDMSFDARRLLRITSIIFGVLLSLYTAYYAGGFFTESFGIFFAIAYVSVLTSKLQKSLAVSLSSILLLGAVFFREPFIFVMLGIAMLLLHTRKSFLMLYVVPQAIAAVVEVFLLWILGYLRHYVFLYLPILLEMRVSGDPLWIKALAFWKVGPDVWEFSPMFLVVLVSLIVALFLLRAKGAGIKGVLVMGGRLAAAAYITLLAVSTGGTYPIYAVPVYAVLFILVAQEMKNVGSANTAYQAVIATLLALNVLLFPFGSLQTEISSRAEWENDQAVAAQLDTLMDNCGLSHYAYIGTLGGNLYTFTKHSPLGPMFFLSFHVVQDPKLVGSLVYNVEHARLVIVRRAEIVSSLEKGVYDLVANELNNEFTRKPWPCAVPGVYSEEYTVLYRIDPAEKKS